MPYKKPEVVALGYRKVWLFSVPYTVPAETHLKHMALFGATGSGKSTQLLHLAVQNAALPSRPGMLLVDLKDTLASDVALHLPPHRESDVLLFDVADRSFPPAFNPLANVPEESRTLAASELISCFKRLWGDSSWGARLEHVLRNAALTLLETPDATLLDIVRLLTQESYRSFALRHVTNFSVRQFWEQEFPSIVGTRGSVANVESILNKLSILSYPELRNVLGQTNRGLDIGQAMRDGKIVLAHLPQGVLGEDASRFMAALLVAHTQLAAQRRVTIPQAKRKTFLLFADEFQNYDTSSFTKIITEGRSMGLGVVSACQFEEQLSTELRRTILYNCAVKLVCQKDQRGYHIVYVIFPQQNPRPKIPLVLFAQRVKNRPAREQMEFIRARSRRTLARPRAEVEADIRRRMTEPQHQQANHENQEQPRGRKRARYYET